MEANATRCLLQTMHQRFGLGRCICQKRYIICVVSVRNRLYVKWSASCLFSVKPFSFIRTINFLSYSVLAYYEQIWGNFFQIVFASIPDCYKKYCTRLFQEILNKFWKPHLTKQQLYGHLPPISKTIQIRRTKHAEHCWRSKDELISDVLLWTSSNRHVSVGRQ